jgi:hypothetical protein
MPYDDDLDATVTVVTITPATSAVVVGQGPEGPMGPTGPQGTAGASSAFATRSFAIAMAEWDFDHDLGYPPAVMLYDPDGVQIGGQVVLNTASRTVVQFAMPIAGSMSLS